MKILTRILTLFVLVTAGLFFSNCGGDDDGGEPIQQVQLRNLSKTWTITSATLAGVDRTADFQNPNFTLTISGAFNATNPNGPYNFSVAGKRPNPSPWPQSGTWQFGADPSLQMIRIVNNQQELPLDYSINNGTLTISFTCAGCSYAGSRTEAVNGQWVFTFN